MQILLSVRKMKSQNNHPTNFWFGFAVGTLGAAIAAYLVGTKKGRHNLKKLIEFSENMEENTPNLISGIHETLNSLADLGHNFQTTEHHAPHEKTLHKTNSLENVISKIKQATQPDKYVKKFFAKSGKSE